MHRSSSGQATVEYVGVLALLAVLMTLAAVAIAAPDLPGTVVAKMRQALCIVSGDVCSSADAQARGLEPCVTDAEARAEHHGMTIGWLHTNRGGSYLIQRRSDGSVLVMRAKDWGLGATEGLELKAGIVDLGGSFSVDGVFTPGKTWVLTGAQFDDLVARSGVSAGEYSDFDDVLDHRFPTPTSTFRAVSVNTQAELQATLGDVDLGSAGFGSHRELGVRSNADGTSSVYVNVRPAVSGVLADIAPAGLDPDIVAEWRRSDPPHLTLHITQGGPAAGQSEEILAGIDLTDPGLRAQAARAMFGTAVAGGVALRGLARAIRSQGSVERYRYADTLTDSSTDLGFKVGPGLGVDGSSSSLSRRLVGAEVLTGGTRVTREDCLGALRIPGRADATGYAEG